MMRSKSSMELEYCIALRARTKLRHAGGIEPVKAADGGFGDHYAGGVDAEIVARMNQSGHAVHDDAMPLGGHDLEDDVPTLAGRVARPIVVRDHDTAVFGVAAGGDERAAMIARPGAIAVRAGALVVPLVVIRNLQPRVERDHVPNVELHAARFESVGNSIDLVAVLLLYMRPEDLFRCLSEKCPVMLLFVDHLGAYGLECVGNFVGQQVPVLESDLTGFSLQVNLDPTV